MSIAQVKPMAIQRMRADCHDEERSVAQAQDGAGKIDAQIEWWSARISESPTEAGESYAEPDVAPIFRDSIARGGPLSGCPGSGGGR